MYEYADVPVTAGLILMAVGLVNCFWGYKVFRITLSLIGFSIGFAAGYALISSTDTGGAIVVGIVLGGICAAIINVVYFLSVFLGGAAFGIVAITALLSAFDIPPNILAAIVGAILGGIVALFINKLMIIVSTAFIGAAAFIVGGIAVTIEDAPEDPDPGITAFIFVTWLAMSIAGVIYQYKRGKSAIEKL